MMRIKKVMVESCTDYSLEDSGIKENPLYKKANVLHRRLPFLKIEIHLDIIKTINGPVGKENGKNKIL